jgi:hypothetical protein
MIDCRHEIRTQEPDMTILRATTNFAHGIAIAVAASLAFAATASATPASDTPNPNPAPKAVKKSAEKPVRYCVEEIMVGSTLRKGRVCKTREQWIMQAGFDPTK